MTKGWTYHTPERMQMHLWTRKRRLKFRKRWRKQHNGEKFRWFKVEYVHLPIFNDREGSVIFYIREPSDPSSGSSDSKEPPS